MNLYFCAKALRADREVVLAAMAHNPLALGAGSAALRREFGADRAAMLAACQKSGAVLRYATEDLRSDKELVLAAVTSDGNALQFAVKALQSNRQIVLAACQSQGGALRFASAHLRPN